MFDVVIVGARCAGAPLAMLLARRGYRVLNLDAAHFPSATLSTHLIWPLGVDALERWGLGGAIASAGAAICRNGIVQTPGGTICGPWHAVGAVDYTINLRRHKLDAILIEAARQAGAEIREGCCVDGLLYDNQTVEGVSGHDRKSGQRFDEHATVIVGADGRHSVVAKCVGANVYSHTPSLTSNYYTYVESFPGDRNTNEIYTCPPREYLFSPTDGGLTVVNLVLGGDLPRQFKTNLRENFYKAFDSEPELGARLRAARQVDRIYGALDLPNFYRRSYGDGWALVGDAGFCKDPIRAQGITDAFVDAEVLASAIDNGLAGRQPLEQELRNYESARRLRTAFPFDLCLQAARFNLPPLASMRNIIRTIKGKPAMIAEMRGLISGSMRPEVFYSERHQAELLGVEGSLGDNV